MNRIKDIQDRIEKAKATLRDLVEQVEKHSGEWSAEEREKANQIIADLKAEQDALAKAEEDLRLREQVEGMLGVSPEAPQRSPGEQVRKSIGQQFVESRTFTAWLKAVAPSGVIADSTKGISSPPVTFASFKDVITGADATSAGAMVVPTQSGLVDLPVRPLTILDVITRGQTSSDTIEYARVTATTNAAAPTAEATDVAASGLKPESAMTFERVTATVRTIAHWLPATKRALSDAAQLRTLIDNFLRSGLDEVLEDQIVGGDGTGENFTGIANTAGIQTQAWDTDLLTTTRKARTKVTVVGRANPTAYLLHPNDWEAIDLLQDNENRYYFGGPQQLGTPRLWGLPVVVSEALTEGVGYVGDLRSAVLWDREQASIQVSDSHSDFFTRNLVAILAEMRAGFGVLRPAAIVEMDLTAV